jgi:hypothetical protein
LCKLLPLVAARPAPRQLKIAIPKDASKPDGDAVENGVLLSASELQARGFFVNSPSDAAPILPIPEKKNKVDEDDKNDRTYQPPKRSNALDNEAPKSIYTSNGEEVITETEYGTGNKSLVMKKFILMSLVSERKGSRKES